MFIKIWCWLPSRGTNDSVFRAPSCATQCDNCLKGPTHSIIRRTNRAGQRNTLVFLNQEVVSFSRFVVLRCPARLVQRDCIVCRSFYRLSRFLTHYQTVTISYSNLSLNLPGSRHHTICHLPHPLLEAPFAQNWFARLPSIRLLEMCFSCVVETNLLSLCPRMFLLILQFYYVSFYFIVAARCEDEDFLM